MNPDELGPRLVALVLALPLFLFALTVHEYAHAWMARREGDPTAEQEGRLTLDPLQHLDPVGVVMFVLSSLAGFGFGWAKPVPVRLGNCREPLKAMLRIAAAGPLSNLLQALAAFVLLVLLGLTGTPVAAAPLAGLAPVMAGEHLPLLAILAALVGQYLQVNVFLAIFNLIPIPPLDGGRILVSVLPYRLARTVASLEQYGFVILFVGFRLFAGLMTIPAVALLRAAAQGLFAMGLR